MLSHPSSAQTEERRFRLVKYFAYTSFLVFAIFCFPFSVLISQNAKDILMKSYENYAILLGENLNHQVFQNFVIPVATRFGKISLRQPQQSEFLDQIVRNTIHGFHIDLVNIYDIDRNVIAYSTDPENIGKMAVEKLGYKKAVDGELSSGLTSGGGNLLGIGLENIGEQKKLRTYIPFRGMDPLSGRKGHVLGVFELTQDLTQEYQSVVKLQYLIFGLSIIIMALIFVSLILIVRKAEGIIEKRAKEQIALEAQLNQAERLATLGQMIAGVSHEIRNPLGIIRSTAELLSGMGGADETQKKLSNMIIESSNRLNNIVTEFMDFARPQNPDLQDCFLEEIITRNLDFLRPELDKQNIAVQDNLKNRSFKFRADPHLLYRAFLNLFINAIQSMNNGGTINVNLSEENNSYVVGIRDTGKGIHQDTINKIFSPFFSTKDKGSGLGLPIVKNIIEAHNGEIRINSVPDSGTEVIILLPKK